MTKCSSLTFSFLAALCVGNVTEAVANKKCSTCQSGAHVVAAATPHAIPTAQQGVPIDARSQIRHPFAPPPGTLGRTYYRATRMVPAYKHPRVCILDVHVANAATVQVYHTSPFREEDLLDGYQDFRNVNLWRFESKPLIPGIPQIYRVEAVDSIGQRKVRYVRLIPGRVIDLDFSCDPNCKKTQVQ